tara:strand:+ start:350 stop:1021 length:672 start_codon:yes stop_codon:yes gene_type:complete
MAIQFKNFGGIVTTTGSVVGLLEAPTGKTCVITTLNMFNNTNGNMTYGNYLKDVSESSNYYTFGAPDFVNGNYDPDTLTGQIHLEAGDLIGINTDVQPIHIWGSYLLIDEQERQRYRHITKHITSTGSTHSILTAPANTTCIVKWVRWTNVSGSTATMQLYFYDSSASGWVYIESGDVADDNYWYFTAGMILEPGDILGFVTTQQPADVNVMYMEIPTPSIRA